MAGFTAPNAQKMKFTKTETEYNMKSVRFLLLTITTMFIVIGLLMIVLGISVYSQYHDFSFLCESVKSGRFLTPSVLTVFLGFVLLVVTSFGFFGSLKRSTCMVNLYALLLTLILIIKLVIVILAFTIDSTTMMKYIFLPISKFNSDSEIEQEINSLQYSLNCCGGDSFMDYMGMEFGANQSTKYIITQHEGNLMHMPLPDSCCILHEGDRCLTMHRMGCKEALVNVMVQNASVIGVLGVSVMFIMLLGIIFALLLARCIRKLKTEKAMMEWQMKEKMILARLDAMKMAESEQSVYIAHPDSSLA